MPSGIQVFASIRNPDAPSQPAARPRTAIRLLFGEALAPDSERVTAKKLRVTPSYAPRVAETRRSDLQSMIGEGAAGTRDRTGGGHADGLRAPRRSDVLQSGVGTMAADKPKPPLGLRRRV